MKRYTHLIHGRTFIIVMFFTFLLAYVMIRAYTLSFTHDESLSFTILEGNDILINTANNHILNTTLMAKSNTLFGNTEFSLRLPNVLAFVLYLIGCFYLIRTSKSNWLFFFGFTIILLNPFMIEFFSLARGYGLSLAFMLISIFFMIRNGNHYLTSSPFIKDFIFASLFASLALYAILAMINFYISILIIFIFKYIYFRRTHPKDSNFNSQFYSVLFVSLIPLFLGIQRLLKLKEANQLYFGVNTFMEGINSLVGSSIYFTGYGSWLVTTIKIIVFLFLIVGILSIILKKKYDGPLFIIIQLIAFLSIGLFLEHLLFSAAYPAERTALFFIPIISLFIYHLFLHLKTEHNLKKQYYIPVIICLMISLGANFIVSLNSTYTKTWRYDAHTKDAMKIVRDITQDINYKTTISNPWLLEPAINHYIGIWRLNVAYSDRNGIDLNSDFIYRREDNDPLDNYKELCSYEDIQSSLLMKIE